LCAFLARPAQVLGRKDLFHDVWAIDLDPETNVVDVQVARQRRKLDRFGPSLIHTIRGEGYRLSAR
jgi:two-component system OmpR family response regulator